MTLIGSLMELLGRNRGHAKLQELAEKAELAREDEAWLERRFERHPEERSVYRESRRWLEIAQRMRTPAPRPGLADRALARARLEEEREVQARVVGRPRLTWSLVTGAVAVGVFAYAIGVQLPDRGVGGASTAGWSRTVSPDLVIVSSAAPAEAGSRFKAVVERFGGRLDDREGGPVAELPSAALLELIESLQSLGALEVENEVEVGALESRRRVVVRLSFR
jgi:hypothetical protein